MKHISYPKELPKDGESFCAIKGTTIYTPGDQRSKDCPGHGYPESWDPAIEMISFGTSDELATWATKNHADLSKYLFFKLTPLHLEPTVTISVTAPATRGSDTMGYQR